MKRKWIRVIMHETRGKSGRLVDFWHGDGVWAPSLHFNWRWRGQWFWVCVFFG